MKRNILNITLTITLTTVFILFAFWILAIKNGFMLRWLDEMSLFQPGLDSLRQFMLYPGGIFRFAATFLTQILYYPAVGSGVLILIWLLCAWLTKVSFRLSGSTFPMIFLVPLCLLASVLHFDEACLTFESQGYAFYNSLGFTFSLSAYCIFALLRHKAWGCTAIAVTLPLLYPLAGYFALLPAMMAAISLCLSARKERKVLYLAAAAISLAFVMVIPPLYYRYFTGTTADNYLLYLKGLPELTSETYDNYLWVPFAVASVILLLLPVLRNVGDIKKTNTSKAMKWTAAALFIIGIAGCLNADGKKSEQLRATILMAKAIEEREWSRVVHIMSLTKESPNYTMCVLDNLARAYCGMERRSVGNMRAESKDFRHNENFTITAFVDVPVNHHIGRFNQSHRWATEHIVQYGNRVFFIKYIVLNAIMNGDVQFAKKFNNLLMPTMFHRRWAENMNKYIDDPSLVKTLPGYDFLMALRAEEILAGE